MWVEMWESVGEVWESVFGNVRGYVGKCGDKCKKVC